MLRRPPSGERAPSARRDLWLSSAEGTSYCLMVGVGQEYFVAFALAAGLSDVQGGLVATLPMFVGATAQLASPWVIRRVGSLRNTMTLFSALQALCFVPLLAGAWHGTIPAWALYLTVTVYAAINLSQGPAWSTWITTLVPRRIRARYFGGRWRVLQGGVLAGLLIGGLVLDKSAMAGANPGTDPVTDSAQDAAASGQTQAFIALFAIALAMRVLGCFLISRHSEPVRMPDNVRTVSPLEIVRRWRGGGPQGGAGADVRLLGFLMASNFAMQVALPFFTPFVLNQRGLTYLEFTTLTGAVIVGKMVAAPTIGRVAHGRGALRVLWVGAIGVIPMAPLWLVADTFATLLIAQFVMGCLLSCFDIGAMLMQYETIPEHERASLISSFVAMNALAGFLGSLAGGMLLAFGQEATGLLSSVGGYGAVFLLGAAARIAVLPMLVKVRPAPAGFDAERAGTPRGGAVRVDPGAGTSESPSANPGPDRTREG
ncbi:MAG: MFS transporter [Phycisphaerales bacterium JB040]